MSWGPLYQKVMRRNLHEEGLDENSREAGLSMRPKNETGFCALRWIEDSPRAERFEAPTKALGWGQLRV